MNHRQLVLVRMSYERIRMVRPLFADLFHRRLFLVVPRLELILPADPARRDAAFLELVDTVVQRLDRLDILLPTLATYARTWNKRGVVDADYPLAGKALAWTVEQLIKEPAAIAAWRDTFDFMSGVMRRAVSDAQAIPPVPPPRRTFNTQPYADAGGGRPPTPPGPAGPPPSSRRGSVAPESPGSQLLP